MKTILITGTTSGIGTVTALELARAGHHVVMANRNREKSEMVRDKIIEATANTNVNIVDLDLASRKSIEDCAKTFLEVYPSLDILINNAGLMSNEQVITADGFELQFAVNALSPFQLTLELLPALEAAAPSQVIFVTSLMHRFGKLDFDSFKGWNKYSSSGSYSQSKLAMTMLACELAKQLRSRDISVNSLHPGAVNTGILHNYSALSQFFLKLFFTSPEKGAKTSLLLAGMNPEAMPTGEYFDGGKKGKTHRLTTDDSARKELWNACCEYLGKAAYLG